MNDQNNTNNQSNGVATGQSDLNSILSNSPTPPVSDTSTQATDPGGGLMSPPISMTPPGTPAPEANQSVDFTSNLTLNTPPYQPVTPPTTDVPQSSPFAAPPPPPSPAATPISLNTPTETAPPSPAQPIELNIPGTQPPPTPSSNPMDLSSTPQPQNTFNWSPASDTPTATPTPEPPAASPDQPAAFGTGGTSPSTFTPADLSNVSSQTPQSPIPPLATGLPTSTIPETPAIPTIGTPTESATVPTDVENAPTDLSHLMQPADAPINPYTSSGTTEGTSSYNPLTSQTDSLVIPTNTGNTSTGAQVTTAKDGIPKWVIILGVVLLLAVAAASAYFILGVGRNSTQPASAPATTENSEIVPVAKPSTAATPVATSSAQPVATGSGGLNNQNQSASSAADLLRQRQGL
jgi:hypothetical protein